jgi:hypothetical protein
LTRDLICNTTRALARTVLVDVMNRKEMCDGAVCAIGDVVAVLTMISLLVAARTDPEVLYRRSIWFKHAPAIPIHVALTRAFPSWDTSKRWYTAPCNPLIIARASFLFLMYRFRRGTTEVVGALMFGRDDEFRGIWCGEERVRSCFEKRH